ncbi:hypothetical protein B0A49_06755 [Cryomyces minteri]|uniref:DUF4484 domain-containing protein n=1 Tax=Cryomyces minteri TaxID=331657 RepID=A0A4U0WSU1_9PEZI|nr:hypothetical protein B0A49_06755 [Cryomyces minteri]
MPDDDATAATDGGSSPHDAAQLPPVAAAFLIHFDQRVGYQIAWQRALPGIDLEGIVEFKSLPSGLHNVKEDLVYFVHEDYAGISAFVNSPAGVEDRNAHLVAVGVLVPLSYGRLGKAWLCAEKLRGLSELLAHDATKTELLQEFWEKHREDGKSASPDPQSLDQTPPAAHGHREVEESRQRRNRAFSDSTHFTDADNSLSSTHPALSLSKLLDLLGPLIFPLYRAALLRKRILLLTSAPVRQPCEYVYDLSIISSIPSSMTDLLSLGPESETLLRIRPLFTVGIHDIPLLGKEAAPAQKSGTTANAEHNIQGESIESRGWVACTTDDILSSKTQLYDLLVETPADNETGTKSQRWTRIRTSQGKTIKATQRDLRRYRSLKHEVSRLTTIRSNLYSDEPDGTDDEDDHENEDEDTALLPDSSEQKAARTADDAASTTGSDAAEKLVEPVTWSALAYSSFMWWASAGERDSVLVDEAELDQSLLSDLSFLTAHRPRPHSSASGASSAPAAGNPAAKAAMALIAYFHRLTTLMLETMAEIVDAADDGVGGGDEDAAAVAEVVAVSSEDIGRMGLDVWSEADRCFVKEMLKLYFGREAEVKGAGVECCGVRIA